MTILIRPSSIPCFLNLIHFFILYAAASNNMPITTSLPRLYVYFRIINTGFELSLIFPLRPEGNGIFKRSNASI